MKTFPKHIKLRVTRAALAKVPAVRPIFVTNLKLAYTDSHRCLLCQAVRRQFRNVRDVEVSPGEVTFGGECFSYDYLKYEDRIEQAHVQPEKFKPFTLVLRRY